MDSVQSSYIFFISLIPKESLIERPLILTVRFLAKGTVVDRTEAFFKNLQI